MGIAVVENFAVLDGWIYEIGFIVPFMMDTFKQRTTRVVL
jgi:hypothetical protein